MHLDEVMEHTGRVDGQLIITDALDHIDDSEQNIKSFTWETDEEEYNSRYLTHFYNDTGTYNITLTIEYNNGDIIQDTTTVETKGIDVVRTGTKTYSFSPPNDMLDESNVTYRWNLGAGITKTGEYITHSFEREGLREVDLYIILDDGSEIIKTNVIDIE